MKIQEVIDRVLTDSTGETRIAPTCDQLMTGDPQQEVKGIAVTFMATVEVIREAAAKGVNFLSLRTNPPGSPAAMYRTGVRKIRPTLPNAA